MAARRKFQPTKKAPSQRVMRRRPAWAALSDEDLLDMRLCNLRLRIAGSRLEQPIGQLYAELEARDIRLRPHLWLSSEWFCPDGVPGIAIPFYLAHERLMKLEEKMMLEVEGGRPAKLIRLLRHEAGHALCNGYRLHYRRQWREIFGRFSQPYPEMYQPKPYSRDYVLHLDWWYSQAHPAEDFAETFAVWLRPGSRWRQQYNGWPALRKLQYVDELMKQIAGKPPPVRRRERIEPLRELTTTLREHYRLKRRRAAMEWPEFYDRDLRRLFSDDPRFAARPAAAAFLRQVQADIRRHVAQWTGVPQYTIDQVLRDIIDRCRELDLRLTLSQRASRVHATIMVTVQAMNHLRGGHYRITL